MTTPSELSISRKTEINSVLPSGVEPSDRPHYIIVDAPVGYGKTAFLQCIQEKLEKESAICIYTKTDQPTGTDDDIIFFLSKIIKQINSNAAIEKKIDDLSFSLITEIDIFLKKQNKKYIALLIDINYGSDVLIKYIAEKLIPNISIKLFLNYEDINFQFIIAGTGINSFVSSLEKVDINFNFITLPLLTYSHIQRFVRAYLKQKDEKIENIITAQAAAHITFFSAGHPGSIDELLSKHWRSICNNPNEFFSTNGIGREFLQKKIVRVAREMQKGFNDHQASYFNIISVLRYANYQMIKGLFAFEKRKEVEGLTDTLTKTYLFTWRGQLLENRIVRKIFALSFKHSDPKAFFMLCKKAQELCMEQVKSNKVQQTEKWVLEYLFQILQHQILSNEETQINSNQLEIDHLFFDKYLPDVLSEYFANNAAFVLTAQQKRKKLESALEEDIELCFLVNYALRGESFTSAPYQKLKEKISGIVLEESNIGSLTTEAGKSCVTTESEISRRVPEGNAIESLRTVIDEDSLTDKQKAELVNVLQGLFQELPDSLTDEDQMKFIAPAINDPAATVSHKLEVTYPIIPFILSYKGEVDLSQIKDSVKKFIPSFLQRIKNKKGAI